MISTEDAVKAAKQKLDEMQVDYAGRQVTVTPRDTYKVVFPPPPGMRAGDFTLIVDAETGEVLGVRIER